MAQMAQTPGPLPFKSSIVYEILSSEIASVVIGFLIFYFVQTRFLSRWSPSSKRNTSKLVDKAVEFSGKSCDSPVLPSVTILESVPGPTQSSTVTTNQSTNDVQKPRKTGSFFADRHQQRQSHVQNFRPTNVVSNADTKPLNNDTQSVRSFFADRQQQRQSHIQNFKPQATSHRSSLGPTGPPPGLAGSPATPSLNANDPLERPSRLGRRTERRAHMTATLGESDPLSESLGCTGLNGNEGALLQLWTEVMSMPKKEATTPTIPLSTVAISGRGRTRSRANDRKRF